MNTPDTPILGIDIGGTSVKAALLAHGAAPASGKSDTYSRPTRDQLILAIQQACHELGRDARVVGVCAPGAWNDATNTIAHSVNVPGVVGTPLDALVHQALGVHAPVHLFTDAHAAAYDVWSRERLRGRLLCVSIGTGVGAAVLDDGALLQVSGRSSGHMGQWDVTLEQNHAEIPIAPDGSRGTLEAYLGAEALRRRYRAEPQSIPPRLSAEEQPIRALARALRIAHAIYRPQHIRLVGGLGIRLGVTLLPLRACVSDQLTSLARPDWTFAVGADDFHAARGAARLAEVRITARSVELG